MFNFCAGKFVKPEELTARKKRDAEFGVRLCALLLQAGEETGVFDLDEVRSRGRCLLAANALVDVLGALGRRDACLHRSGINVTTWRGGSMVSSTTVGHPAAPPVSQLWNAHMTVRLGERLLFDPTFPQMLGPFDKVVHTAVFMREPSFAFDLHGYGQVDAIASASWLSGPTRHTAHLFHLPRKVEVATRKWPSRPDAQPELRATLVERTLELFARNAAFEAISRISRQSGRRAAAAWALEERAPS